jgi:uncharacterized protein YqeY
VSPEEIRQRLKAALLVAMKAKDTVATAALRSAIAAIGNAEAVPPPAAAPLTGDARVAGSVAGLGAAEARRRALTEADLVAIIAAEASERRAAALAYEAAGDAGRGTRLRREADVIASVLDGP